MLGRLGIAREAIAPALLLLGTLGTAAAFELVDDRRTSVAGYAQIVPEIVASTEQARVASIAVGLGEEVVAGQIIATLDASLLEAEIAIARAERGRLEAAVHAERAQIDRRFQTDRETLERESSRAHEDQLRLQAEAKALDVEIERVKKLIESREAVASDLAPLTLRRAAIATLAAEKPKTLSVLDKQLASASRREHDVDAVSSGIDRRLDADLEVVARRVDLLEKRREGFVLRAARKGRVAAIEKRSGETAAPGEAIVRVVGPTERVVACVPERAALGLREGDPARLWVKTQRNAPMRGKTVSLGPIVAELPARCWTSPRTPVWGREIIVALETPLDAVAGESFEVALESAPPAPSVATTASLGLGLGVAVAAPTPAASPGGHTTALPALPLTQPRPMRVPPTLVGRTRFEPSGLLARPGEGRFLVVSDDTGKKDVDEGLPWLFAMRADGEVEAEPIPIQGVSTIDDLEAITAGPSGELYVLASQSYSKKGKRKPARTALLRLVADGKGFRVTGEAHLAELFDAAPERGKLTSTRDLDVEAMTFHDGALFFGLKAPLLANGAALVWRVGTPGALFDPPAAGGAAGSTLDAAGFEVWGAAKVDVLLDGKTTPGGISDMLFLADGSLIVSATPSTAEGDAGALYRLTMPSQGPASNGAATPTSPGRTLTAAPIARFPAKAEGIAPSKEGHLLVVFDNGDRTPAFVEVPCPR